MKIVVFIKGSDTKLVFEPAEILTSDSNSGEVIIDAFSATLKEFGPNHDEDFDKIVIHP